MLKTLTQEDLHSKLYYDKDTGIFTWLDQKGSKVNGKVAGSLNSQHGYINIQLDGDMHRAHRLAWLYIYGSFPTNQIDHINGIPDDNRLCNLRDVESVYNNRNRSIQNNNTSGVMGVTLDKRYNIWTVRIGTGKERKYIGSFKDKRQAIQCRKEAEIKYNYHKNHGRVKYV